MMPQKELTDFNLFARFATSELTHSGIWAWVLQSLDPDCPPELHELRAPARALLTRLGVELAGAVTVRREVSLPGRAGRVDVEVEDEQGRVVVIETKVKATPDLAQRERYADAYRESGRKLVAITILSTTFEEPWGHGDAEHLGATDVLDIVRAGIYRTDTMQQYSAWLEDVVRSRQDELAAALGDDPAVALQALKTPAVQWGVMSILRQRLGGSRAVRLYCGRNLDGSPWTQLAFAPGAAPDFDALFYRLECRGAAAEFTLRQYLKPAPPSKSGRLDWLRGEFQKAQATAVPGLVLDTEPRFARREVQEAKVAQYTLPPGNLSALLRDLPAVHERFVTVLRSTGWPIGPDPS
jgi:hypothetical protein